MLREACSRAGCSASEVHFVAIHQANLRIIECLQKRTGIAREKWLVNIGRLGNTAAPSELMALHELLQRGHPPTGRGSCWEHSALD